MPSYLVDELRRLTGGGATVENATDLLIDAADGLRVVNEADQLARLEWAACQTSEGVKRLLFGLRPGMTEQQAVALLGWNGMPLSCHLMLTAGPRARFGLLSPTDRPIERGDPFTTAFGIWGALNCRAGWLVAEAARAAGRHRATTSSVWPGRTSRRSPSGTRRSHVGQTGGALQTIVDRRLGDPFFGIFLNPGHQIHLDEWVNSPVWPGSTVELRSGMALQVDIIPATGTDYFTTNIEDGIALADATLRAELAARYPEAWARIQAPPRVHGRRAGHPAPPRRAAVLEHPRLPAAVPAGARSRADRGLRRVGAASPRPGCGRRAWRGRGRNVRRRALWPRTSPCRRR